MRDYWKEQYGYTAPYGYGRSWLLVHDPNTLEPQFYCLVCNQTMQKGHQLFEIRIKQGFAWI